MRLQPLYELTSLLDGANASSAQPSPVSQSPQSPNAWGTPGGIVGLALGAQASQDKSKRDKSRQAYRESLSKPLPEKKKPKTNTTALGLGLSLLGEFLARSMDRDGYRPGQVVGGYMQGVGARRAQEGEEADQEFQSQLAQMQREQDGLKLDAQFDEEDARVSMGMAEKFRQEAREIKQTSDQAKAREVEAALKTLQDGNNPMPVVEHLIRQLDDLGRPLPNELRALYREKAAEDERAAREKAERDKLYAETQRLYASNSIAGNFNTAMNNQIKNFGEMTPEMHADLERQRQALEAQGMVFPGQIYIPKPDVTLAREKFVSSDKYKQLAHDLREKKIDADIFRDQERLGISWAQVEIARERMLIARSKEGSAPGAEATYLKNLKAYEGEVSKAWTNAMARYNKHKATLYALGQQGKTKEAKQYGLYMEAAKAQADEMKRILDRIKAGEDVLGTQPSPNGLPLRFLPLVTPPKAEPGKNPGIKVPKERMKYVDMAIEIAGKEGITAHLPVFLKMLNQESGFNPKAVNKKSGATGIGQLMPGTARDLKVDPKDPRQNITGAARYFNHMLKQFKGDVRLALAAYNAGPGNVRKYKGVPPFRETQDYIKKILG